MICPSLVSLAVAAAVWMERVRIRQLLHLSKGDNVTKTKWMILPEDEGRLLQFAVLKHMLDFSSLTIYTHALRNYRTLQFAFAASHSQ